MDITRLLLILVHAGLWTTLLANLLYLRRTHRRRWRASTALPSVSVLIPARNEANNLRRLLPSLLAQDYPAFEVVVYDDASEDETQAVLQSFADERLRVLCGEGPPPDWAGKVHALFQATRRATGDSYLFLDADACLEAPSALRRLAERFGALPERSVLTGFTRLRGGGNLLVSLVPHTMLVGLSWPLVRRLPFASLSALNGQCWMIEAATYHQHEPHGHLPAEVLEDVMIGRYLKTQGLTPVLVDVQREVSVFMYAGFREAWAGFRKNAYLLAGGTPMKFIIHFTFFLITFCVAPFLSAWFLLSLYLLKLTTDRTAGFPLGVSLLAPLSFFLALLLQLDSALGHWTGRVSWKGRRIARSH